MKAVLFAAISLCATQSLAQAADFKISVSPATGAIIASKPVSTCLDHERFAKSGGQLGASESGASLSFGGFGLQVATGEALYVQGILIVVKAKKIVGGQSSETIYADEVDALLGTKKGVVIGPADIRSDDKARHLPLVPCGLVIGGINLIAGARTTPFAATVTVTVLGTLKKRDGHADWITPMIRVKARFAG